MKDGGAEGGLVIWGRHTACADYVMRGRKISANMQRALPPPMGSIVS